MLQGRLPWDSTISILFFEPRSRLWLLGRYERKRHVLASPGRFLPQWAAEFLLL
jgi:hypothetical protein